MPTEPDASTLVRDIVESDGARWASAWDVRTRFHAAAIRFDRPIRTLPISVTGAACSLQCAHCGGRYLQHMHSLDSAIDTPATSLLISGGCDRAGRVPVLPALEAIKRLAAGRRLNWHVGQIDEATLLHIAPCVDLVSYDVVGDAATSREVYGLDLDLADYLRTFDMLRRHVRTVPHITLGLRGGVIGGEYDAVEALATRRPDTVVFLVLIPTSGTRYADRQPPALADVADVLLTARVRLPESRLYLGCMRPRQVYGDALDVLAVRAGLDAIVNPSRHAVRAAADLGLEITWGEECCALD